MIPFITGPLSDIFDYSFSCKFVQLIDDQPLIMNDINLATKDFPQKILASKKKQSIGLYLSNKALKKKSSSWRESTTTSLPGLHLGHWRTLCMDYKEDEKSDGDRELQIIQEQIL